MDAISHKGIYELQIADARFATTGAKSILISISGAANLAECDVVIPLRSVDPYSANNFMTGVGGKTFVFDANNLPSVNLVDVNGTAATGVSFPANFGSFAIDANGRVQIQPGTATGQVDLTTGRVKLVDGSITTATYTAGAITATVAPNLDAAVSSRSTYAGGAVASVTAPVTVGSLGAGSISTATFASGATIPAVAQINTPDLALSGTVTGSPTAGSFQAAGLPNVGSVLYTGKKLVFTSGNLKSLDLSIATDAGGAAPRTLTFSPAFPIAPANGDSFIIIG